MTNTTRTVHSNADADGAIVSNTWLIGMDGRIFTDEEIERMVDTYFDHKFAPFTDRAPWDGYDERINEGGAWYDALANENG